MQIAKLAHLGVEPSKLFLAAFKTWTQKTLKRPLSRAQGWHCPFPLKKKKNDRNLRGNRRPSAQT